MSQAWIIVTEEKQTPALVAMAKGLGGKVIAAVIGPRALAEAAAAAGPDAVKWVETEQGRPAEAYAGPVARLIAADAPGAVVASASAAGRVLAGATAVKLGAAMIPRGLKLSAAGETTLLERADLDGRVIETIASAGPVVTFYAGGDVERTPCSPAPIETVAADGVADIRLEKTEPAAGADAGITKASVVVSVGRGLKKKDDLTLIQGLATALGAEIGCSMPVADDLGWVEKERYVGRSGQHITPRLYIAVGIQGAPQHLEGIRGTKVVVGINNDPDAPIFKAADFGIVGDLYEVVPALRAALGK
ncbi:Electron transfer flavoprotein alpha subunit [Solidesulfovibrio fructosivorans JJ]]|uniref:Electron transfer flavoprotein alpha subunit n=1 Tax=Solidesulfovibrio fructosivorans JJ] TaxID=596151 RepID=E1JVP6_SOLFR|nr:electron transfer flavoprotein subunit alpha/FixB family protein [Solidesulfovibrio fructosivorans]EFL51534.1 Electron transfer flavoprotein alpha subunit [Solidesulfovibrio fructosivorans JJ]]